MKKHYVKFHPNYCDGRAGGRTLLCVEVDLRSSRFIKQTSWKYFLIKVEKLEENSALTNYEKGATFGTTIWLE